MSYEFLQLHARWNGIPEKEDCVCTIATLALSSKFVNLMVDDKGCLLIPVLAPTCHRTSTCWK